MSDDTVGQLLVLGVTLMFFWLSIGALGGWVARQKGRGEGEGWFLGLVFGPFGVLLEALLPTNCEHRLAQLRRAERNLGR